MDPKTTKALNTAGPKLISHKISLEVVEGPCCGLKAELSGPEVRIGNKRSVDLGCDLDLVLNDPTVSRLHLVLRIEGDRIRVIDPGSMNGSFVDGIQINDAYARLDSVITIGNSKLRLKMVEDPIELPLSNATRMSGLIGQSVGMRFVYSFIERVAKTDHTVLIEGESGTGKELAAQAIHDKSSRAQGHYQTFDCSAVAPTLIEDALFGHAKGGFSGALTDKAGFIERADGGTLFLDEVGELPLDVQAKLLRALQERTICRIGSTVERKINVRFIAATNRNLAQEVERGRFREDVYQRLNVLRIQLPPLRERKEDIPLLVRHFEASLGPNDSVRGPLEEHEIAALMERSYRGNVRELEHTVIRIHALGISPGASEKTPAPAPAPKAEALPAEKQAIAVDLSPKFARAKEQVIEAFQR